MLIIKFIFFQDPGKNRNITDFKSLFRVQRNMHIKSYP